jgi:hypothetical protein
MRLAALLLSLTCAVGSAACKDKGDASPDPAALKAQQDLMARREALTAERRKLEERRGAIEAEKEAAKGDPSKLEALEKEKSEIESKIQKSTSDETSLANELTKVTAVAGDVASREAGLAARERAVAQRERDVNEREQSSVRALSEAANQLRIDALKFKESCNAGGAAPMIVQVPAPKSGNYSRAEVDGVYGKAKKIMRDKGLIPGDQWAGASLEADTAASLGKQDWGTAFVTASQLVNYATQFKVDRTFVQAKIGRLNQLVRSSKRDEQVQKQLTDGLSDVMTKFGDGNHIAANVKLNALFSLVR